MFPGYMQAMKDYPTSLKVGSILLDIGTGAVCGVAMWTISANIYFTAAAFVAGFVRGSAWYVHRSLRRKRRRS